VLSLVADFLNFPPEKKYPLGIWQENVGADRSSKRGPGPAATPYKYVGGAARIKIQVVVNTEVIAALQAAARNLPLQGTLGEDWNQLPSRGWTSTSGSSRRTCFMTKYYTKFVEPKLHYPWQGPCVDIVGGHHRADVVVDGIIRQAIAEGAANARENGRILERVLVVLKTLERADITIGERWASIAGKELSRVPLSVRAADGGEGNRLFQQWFANKCFRMWNGSCQAEKQHAFTVPTRQRSVRTGTQGRNALTS
jgi:hypothetical protein